MKEEYIRKYCELVIKVGVNLYNGQCLLISSGTGNSDFALMLAESAYRNGAKFVDVIFNDSRLSRIRIDHSISESDLQYIPDFYKQKNYELITNDWAIINIDNLEEQNIMKGVDVDKLGIVDKADFEFNKPVLQALTSSKISWCIVAVPGPRWAAKVLNAEVSEKVTEEFTDKIIKVLRLDDPDPVEKWRTLGEKLIQRCSVLTEMKLDKLIFKGPGTDLEIGLNNNSNWVAGFVTAGNGRKFMPNIPTEEVFNTPDFKRTNGKVKVTKPVKVMGNQLNGIWFEFKDGKIIDCGSDNDKEILQKYLSMDEGAKYLGEVALVDKHSEVHKSGLIFNSILYDENAACHIAVGRGITMCFPNKNELNTPEDMLNNGCNYSLIHRDFMIGSDEINVTGFNGKGKEIVIIKDGEFRI